jgi:membrane dipeptidase
MASKVLMSIIPLLLFGCKLATNSTDEELLKRARNLHQRIVSIDTHTDTPLAFLRPGFDFGGNGDAKSSKVNLLKMEQGGLDAAFFAVFIGQDELSPEKYIEANQRAMEIFDAVRIEVDRHPNRAEIATNSSDAKRLKNVGKKAIFIGVENGYPIGTNLATIEEYFNLGARYLTLCHTRNNQICDSSTDPDGPVHNGLSPFGIEVVKELNRLGMLIDVSHISDKSVLDCIKISAVPVFASHSCARALSNTPRNLSDTMLVAIAQSGGVIQLCLLSDYIKEMEPYPARDSAQQALRIKYNNYRNLSPEVRQQAIADWYAIDDQFPPKLATVADAVDHIDHIVKVAGINHIGIGSDFDGGGGIDGCSDASQMVNITVELLKRGYSEKDIEKIWGLNFLRVMNKAETYAIGLK